VKEGFFGRCGGLRMTLVCALRQDTSCNGNPTPDSPRKAQALRAPLCRSKNEIAGIIAIAEFIAIIAIIATRGEFMALAITINDVDTSTGSIFVFGTLTPSGSYATGGDTLDFTTVAAQIGASQPPVHLWAGGTTGDAYSWIAGSALNNGKIKINTASATELAAGTYPARISGDTNIQFEATFRKLI